MASYNFNFVIINGELKLPIGYRFRPTDEELLVHYLKPKVFGIPLPASVIPDFDVFRTHPMGLPGDLREKRYFFSKNRGNNHTKHKRKRVAGFGYWKLIGKEKQIVASETNQVVGMRKTLVFCSDKRFQGSTSPRCRWLMHQFHLVCSQTTTQIQTQQWVVHCVFQRKTRPKRHGIIISEPSKSKIISVDLMVEGSSDTGPPQPCSSCSTEINHLPSIGLLDQEASNRACIFCCQPIKHI